MVLNARILEKPRDIEDAHDMLRTLSGTSHAVLTALVLVTPHHGATSSRAARQEGGLDYAEHINEHCRLVLHVTRTEVDFEVLSEDVIHAYVRTGLPMDKAGGCVDTLGIDIYMHTTHPRLATASRTARRVPSCRGSAAVIGT